jgi:predicted regulator of Ras-like GTPase activity (Roadblock/LC7/MglB family)
MFPRMDANEALDRLLAVSDEIRAAAVFVRGGEPIAATTDDEDARELAGLGDAMLAYADALRDSSGVRQLEGVTPEGSVFVVRDGDRAVVAIAAPGALVGLVQHDLRMLLGSLSRRRQRAKAGAAA